MFERIKNHRLDEKSLKKISVIMSLAGLAIIFLLESHISIPVTAIGQIGESDSGSRVKVCGQAENIYTTPTGHLFFNLDDGSSIRVVFFNTTLISAGYPEDGMKESETLCIEGEIDTYKGTLEVIGSKFMSYSRDQ